MTTEEILIEVIKSPELQEIFDIPLADLEQVNLKEKSDYPVIEIIKTIINGQENHWDKNRIFQYIQKQIMQL